jgi:hypothetical protein
MRGFEHKNLEDQNHCFAYEVCLEIASPLPWKHWFLSHTAADADSFLGRIV